MSASPYECIGVDLFYKQGPKGDFIQYAVLNLSSARVTTERLPQTEKSLELIINASGLTKAEKKINNKLRAEGISLPRNLRELFRRKEIENTIKPNGNQYPVG